MRKYLKAFLQLCEDVRQLRKMAEYLFWVREVELFKKHNPEDFKIKAEFKYARGAAEDAYDWFYDHLYINRGPE